ncbi:helix-turn-helix domain-containing protein [Chelatococcus asaccharovorans]|uniref:Helix-turn-helix protein n=1 Tax=Chelatococcus asaccharovorans TaxID=28210 RepID=A0A2V3UBL9_9HYPH|nr:helix-turn-helix transcriptional regulator [Chelatococcus asaccharovorans]MBS7703269.1 helix-turn-helix transcriptional regulator [Chelatococcus asaccharovorans]PXW61601.1 helix-turn-helix protein [Chelatococcus asaccharovorans]
MAIAMTRAKGPNYSIDPQLLRDLIQSRDLSLREVARRSGLKETYLIQIAAGRIKAPGIDKAQAIARGLNVPLERLSGANPPPVKLIAPAVSKIQVTAGVAVGIFRGRVMELEETVEVVPDSRFGGATPSAFRMDDDSGLGGGVPRGFYLIAYRLSDIEIEPFDGMQVLVERAYDGGLTEWTLRHVTQRQRKLFVDLYEPIPKNVAGMPDVSLPIDHSSIAQIWYVRDVLRRNRLPRES